MTPREVNLSTLKCGSAACRKRVPLSLVYCCDACATGGPEHESTCRGIDASGDLQSSYALPVSQNALPVSV